MEIVVLGAGCTKCKNVYNIFEKVINETDASITLRKEEDIMKIMEYKVMCTPAVVIDGEVILQGRVPSEKEVSEFISGKNKLSE